MDPVITSTPSTLVDVLRDRAREQPDADVFAFVDHDESEAGRLSFGELERRARAVAAGLQALGLAGERALLASPPGRDSVIGLFGCIQAGVVAVPTPPPDPGREYAAPRIRQIAADAQPRAVITTAAIEAGLREVLEGSDALFLAIDTDDFGGDDHWREPGTRADDLALIQYTSGSTSVPRGVMISHENLIHNCEYTRDAFGYSADSRAVMWLPPYHDLGLTGGIVQPVYAGVHIALMSPLTFLANPIAWPRAIERYGASFAGGPDFAFDMLVRRTSPEERAALDLSGWELAYNGAELVRRETIDAFSEAFAVAGFRREAFYPCYGLAEATLMVTGGDKQAEPVVRRADRRSLESGRFEPREEPRGAFDLVGCGRASHDGRLLIVDPETREPLDGGTVGEIWVGGPSVARGYWNRDDETAATFGARLAGSGEGPFLRTGDLGFVLDGERFVTGRITEMVVVDDRAFYATDVERACEEGSGALRHNGGAAFAIEVDGRLRLAIVYEVRDPDAGDHDEVIAAVRASVADQLGLEAEAVALIEPRTLPKTTSGKLQRGRCRGLFLNRELPIVAEWRA
ncbi:MAG: fatty acyl-AMP ligase [Solirubrobacterales bacterium]